MGGAARTSTQSLNWTYLAELVLPFSESGLYNRYVYDSDVDGNFGASGNNEVHFAYLLDPIPPSTNHGRDGIAIHPDGECDGTAGCIGIQTWNDCNRIQYTLKYYHGLKVKVESP